MSNGVKIALFGLVPLALILGAAYGLAKIGLIKLPKNPQLYTVYKALKLPVPQKPVAAAKAPPADPLAAEKRALATMRESLQKERVSWEQQKQSELRDATRAQENAAAELDPRSISRLASVYDQMPPKSVAQIFMRLPETQVIALLRRMDEKQVAQILALERPERAARLTQTLARPASQTARAR
jgi:flagellar motility protein MotE (MotC chaperone)